MHTTSTCPITGMMLHMKIQCGKEDIKNAQNFASVMGATSGCTLRLLLYTLPLEEQGLKNDIHGDASLCSVNIVNELASIAWRIFPS
jgi:hypothetical protein